jgi:FtsH-binding integral membrane protein
MALNHDGEAAVLSYPAGRKIMDLLMTIGVVLLILWLLGLVTSYTLGGFIHILLVLAIIVILIRVIQGRRPIP